MRELLLYTKVVKPPLRELVLGAGHVTHESRDVMTISSVSGALAVSAVIVGLFGRMARLEIRSLQLEILRTIGCISN